MGQSSPLKDILVIVAASILCIGPIVALVASAFVAVPGGELDSGGLAPVADSCARDYGLSSEVWQMMQFFAMGWGCCLALKLCRQHGGLVYSSGSTYLRSCIVRAQTCITAKKDTLLIIGSGVVCMVPIIVLIVSAFTAVPDNEPEDSGLASERSSVMRAFTLGWMVCLILKLCREFVGLVGSSSCAALLSC